MNEDTDTCTNIYNKHVLEGFSWRGRGAGERGGEGKGKEGERGEREQG